MRKRFPVTKTVLTITGGLILIAFFLYYSFDDKIKERVENKVQIIDTWELPEVLKEVSGIAYMGNNLMACIQDEDGIIFIYDLESRKIDGEIEFAGPGDYEAITLAGDTAFVLRSDGTIFEVRNYLSNNIETIEYPAAEKSKKLNFEGLEYDENNRRLLLALKEGSGKDFRLVNSFDLQTGRFNKDPVFRLNFSDTIFSALGKKPSGKFLRPSEITIHPETKKIYVLEGVNPKILILDEKGNPEEIHILSRDQFRQAEGLSFGDKGEIYISNEGNGTPPNILKISLN